MADKERSLYKPVALVFAEVHVVAVDKDPCDPVGVRKKLKKQCLGFQQSTYSEFFGNCGGPSGGTTTYREEEDALQGTRSSSLHSSDPSWKAGTKFLPVHVSTLVIQDHPR